MLSHAWFFHRFRTTNQLKKNDYLFLCFLLKVKWLDRNDAKFQNRPMTKYRHMKEKNLEERFGSQVSFTASNFRIFNKFCNYSVF